MSRDKSRRNGISSWCKECRKENSRSWKSKYPDKAEESRLKRIENYKNSPPEYEYARNSTLKARYGITSSDYDNMLVQQNYSCAICDRDFKQATYLPHVDHCHTTGVVRGLLCSPCNVYLGYTKDNPAVYSKAIDYINKKGKE